MVHKEKNYVQLLTLPEMKGSFVWGVDDGGKVRVSFSMKKDEMKFKQEDRVFIDLDGMTFNILITKVTELKGFEGVRTSFGVVT